MNTTSMVTIAVIVVAALLLVLAGCSGSSNAINALELAVDAAQVAVGVLSSQGVLPANLGPVISGYLTAVSSAIQQAVPIINAGGSVADIAAKLTQLFSNIAQPLLPAGTPQVIIAAVQAVSAAVVNFLANYTAPAAKLKGIAATTWKPNWTERRQLSRIAGKAVKVQAALAATR